jgi:hypothetical protein
VFEDMPPTTRVKRAEDVARKLANQIRSPFMAGMLQRSPTGVLSSTQQSVQLTSCCDVLSQLRAALKETNAADAAQMLSAVLRQQAA